MLIKITICIESKLLLKPETCDSFNSYLSRQLSKFNLAGHGIKPKWLQPLERNSNIIKEIKQILGKVINIIEQKYKKPIAISYKVYLWMLN